MPHLHLSTNVPKEKIPASCMLELSKLVADTLGKAEQYVSIHIVPDQMLIFNRSTEPCGMAVLMSSGSLTIEENKVHSARISEYMEKNFGIPKNRVYINFIDMQRENVGFDGTTFHKG